ncbi:MULTISPECIES: hypothetical protein [Bradyrhizobium]|jgi:hypothetical protein|nr:hypothetical protein [Bradyrhizobium sp. NDS-1]WOH72978.1 hypothetical protein RX330_32695 [Bradyrhizobium sp. NDS-1]
MSKPMISALAQFAAATAGRNMTKAAHARHADLAETIDAEAKRRALENS